MELQTIEIPRAGARETAAEYLRASKAATDPARQTEYAEIARVYREAAKDNVPVISLNQTIAAGGTIPRTHIFSHWDYSERNTVQKRHEYLLPRIAACRSSADFCFTLGIEADGSVRFIDKQSPGDTYEVGRLRIERAFDPPPDYYQRGTRIERWTTGSWAAMVPIVPPKHQPRLGASMKSYVTLFEADDWQWQAAPLPPGDPALLRRLGGDLYAVLATWDLSPLEQLVLTGRSLPA